MIVFIGTSVIGELFIQRLLKLHQGVYFPGGPKEIESFVLPSAISVFRNSRLNRLWIDSAKPFIEEELGSIFMVLVPLLSHRFLRAWAMNLRLLSLLMNAGGG